MPKLHGWWSNQSETRFKMGRDVELPSGVAAFRISNPPFLLCASLRASLEVFGTTTMRDLRAKSVRLTAYLEALLNKLLLGDAQSINRFVDDENGNCYETPVACHNRLFASPKYANKLGRIITPAEQNERGAMLCIVLNERVCGRSIRGIFEAMEKRGIVCDFREPCVIRLTPAPLYCSFSDVYRFYTIFRDVLNEKSPAKQD